VGDEVLSIPEDSPWATAEVPEEEIEFVSDTDSDAPAEEGDPEPPVVDSTAGHGTPPASTGGTGNVTEATRP
jgi:hypothetical protein